MKNLCLLLILFSAISCKNTERNPTSLVIESFLKYQFEEKNFLYECSGMKFDSLREIKVSREQFNFNFDSYLQGRAYSLKHTEIDKGIVGNKVLISTQAVPPKRKVDYYFLRISNGAIVGSNIYYVIWLKEDYYSSGLKFIYKYSDNEVTMIEQLYNCDDWG